MKYIEEADALDLYEDFLDSTNNTIVINGNEYNPAYVLLCTDPREYRSRFNLWLEDNNFTTDESEIDEDEDEDDED